MYNRFCFGALLLACLALTFTGCNVSTGLDSITITPSAVTVSLAPPGYQQGQNQYKAIGYYGHAGHQTTMDITDQVTWSSSLSQVATINSSGLATATGFNPRTGEGWTGLTNITASAQGFNGTLVSNTATFTVTGCSSCVDSDISAVTVLPATQTVATLGVPVQFEAIGLTVSGASVPLTNVSGIQWVSSAPSVATINATTGLATTAGSGTTTITATFTNPDGSGAVGSATLTVAATGSAEPLTALTVAPNAQTALSIGQTAQFLAIATTGSGSSVNLTNQSATVGTQTIQPATWVSSDPSVATINAATGVATSVAAGATVITAIAKNPDGSVVTGAATYTVTVTGSSSSEPLVSLAIVPSAQTLTKAGQTAGLIAIGTTSSGTTVNLTNQTATVGTATIQAATWSSSVPSVTSINAATGVATAVANGTTAITAIAKNPDGTVVTGVATLTVEIPSSPEPLVSLAIVPGSQTLTAAGQTAGLIVIGTTSSGTTVNLTNQTATIGTATIQAATWSTSVTSVATINATTGVATAVANGTTAITAIASNPDGTVVTGIATVTVNIPSSPEPLVSLSIVPASQTLTVANQTAGLIVIGTTSTGTTVNLTNMSATIGSATISAATWSSSVLSVATINLTSGVATAVANGATAITAIAKNPDGTVVTGVATLTVSIPATPEPYVSLAIVPASQTLTTVGQTAQYIAIGTTGTGATVDLTNAATWNSSVTSVATITAPGLAKAGTNSGVTAITAEYANLNAVTHTPDGTVVTGIATLTAAIAATPEPLLSLSILPGSQSVAGAPQTTQFLAIGDFSSSYTYPGQQNMTNVPTYTVNWYSSNPSVATIGLTTGLVTAVGPGTTAITAVATNKTDGSGATAAASFTVTGAQVEPVSALSIFPGNPSLTLPVIGSATPATLSFIAIGTNGTSGLQTAVTSAVNWSSTNPLVATISSSGLATAIGQGSTTITASYTNPAGSGSGIVTATTTLTVLNSAPEPLLSIAVIPATPSVAYPGQTTQLIAIGTFTPTSTQPVTQNLTSTAIWSTSNPAVATVCTTYPVASPPPCTSSTDGLVTAVGQGTAVITAIETNPDKSVVIGTATFTVVNAASQPVASLTIIPNSQSVAKGQDAQFIALGTNGATGLQSDVTTAPNLTWSSSIPTVATICNSTATFTVPVLCPTTPGLASGATTGTTTITAEYTNSAGTVVATAQLTVTNTVAISGDVISISIQPASQTDNFIDQTTQFLAIGTSAQAPYTKDLTNNTSTVWASSNVDVATINNTGTNGPTTGGLGAPAGLATLLYEGTTAITATYTNTDGSSVTGVATLTCPYQQCDLVPPPVLPVATLTVFGAGNNTTNWLVTADSATGVANAIHCGPADTTTGGPVCVGSYPVGTTVVLSTTVTSGTFGGWSPNDPKSPYYCTPSPNPSTSTGLNTCSITLAGDVTIVGIFN